jgi:hypothetical protein
MRPFTEDFAARKHPGPWQASHTEVVGSDRLALCNPSAWNVCVEVIGLNPMAGDAGLLADCPSPRGLRILRHARVRESPHRPRQTAAVNGIVGGKIRRRGRLENIVAPRLGLSGRKRAHEQPGAKAGRNP